MSKYRISATGKLHHLIQLCQDRISVIPTAKKQQIHDSYELEKPSTEMIKMIGAQASELVQPNKLSFKLKIILKDGIGYLMGVALAAWDDPENQEMTQDWREIKIILVRTTDPMAKVPPRFSGEMNLDLNTSYLSKGMELKEETIWFRYITNMPAWAREKEEVLLAGAKWVDQEAFETIKKSVIRTEKEIKLADRNKGPSDEKQRPRSIFSEEQQVHFCLFNKEEREFTVKSLAEVKREAVLKTGGEQKMPEINRSSKPVDHGYEKTKREWEDYDKTPSDHQIPMNSYDQSKNDVKNNREEHEKLVTKVSNVTGNMHSREVNDKFVRNVSNVTGNTNPREEHYNFVRNISNVTDRMHQAKIGPHHGHSAQPECIGGIGIRYKDAHNQCELIVPQPGGNFQESRSRDHLLNTEVPHHIGTTEPLLLPRSPIRNPTTWPNHPLLDEDIQLEKERRRLEEFKTKTIKKVTFGQAAQGIHNAEFEEVEIDQSEEHTYEEIPENKEHDMSTPRSRLGAPIPIRQIRPHRVVLNYTTDRLPLAFLFPSANQSQFNFQETPTPLSITRQVQSEEQVLDVSGEEGWEDENEDEERVEDNNEEVDCSRNF